MNPFVLVFEQVLLNRLLDNPHRVGLAQSVACPPLTW